MLIKNISITSQSPRWSEFVYLILNRDLEWLWATSTEVSAHQISDLQETNTVHCTSLRSQHTALNIWISDNIHSHLQWPSGAGCTWSKELLLFTKASSAAAVTVTALYILYFHMTSLGVTSYEPIPPKLSCCSFWSYLKVLSMKSSINSRRVPFNITLQNNPLLGHGLATLPSNQWDP